MNIQERRSEDLNPQEPLYREDINPLKARPRDLYLTKNTSTKQQELGGFLVQKCHSESAETPICILLSG